jgi:glycosidase
VGEVVSDYEEAIGDGWACWAFSNHDVMRHASRWNLGEDARRLYAGCFCACAARSASTRGRNSA